MKPALFSPLSPSKWPQNTWPWMTLNDMAIAFDGCRSGVSPLSAWPYRRFRHRRPPITPASSCASVWCMWCRPGLVSSYLTNRYFRVLYNGGMSSVVFVLCSVPQGLVLVLGPRVTWPTNCMIGAVTYFHVFTLSVLWLHLMSLVVTFQ